jgi:hypothetical protein
LEGLALMGGLRFDATINIGNILTLVGGIVVALRMYAGVVRRLDRLEARMEPLWQWFTDELREMHVTAVNVQRKDS